jgi:hypothetical protein
MRMIWQNTSTGDRSICLMDGASCGGRGDAARLEAPHLRQDRIT